MIYISLSDKIQIYERRPFTIMEFLGDLGGFLSIITFGFSSLMGPYAKARFEQEVFSQIPIKIERAQGKRLTRSQRKDQRNDFLDKMLNTEQPVLSKYDADLLNEEVDLITKISVPFKILIMDFFCSSPCCKCRRKERRKARILKQMMTSLNNRIDIRSIFNNSINLSLIIDMFLNPNQKMLFMKQASRTQTFSSETDEDWK